MKASTLYDKVCVYERRSIVGIVHLHVRSFLTLQITNVFQFFIIYNKEYNIYFLIWKYNNIFFKKSYTKTLYYVI